MCSLHYSVIIIAYGSYIFSCFHSKKICFDAFPYCPTLAGQYIIKNLILISGALVIASKYNEKYYAEMNLERIKNSK